MIVAELGPRRLLATIGWPLAALFGWDVLVAAAYQLLHERWPALGSLPMSMLGSALAIFLVLRSNVAYARWWEARTLFGAVVGASRTLARQLRLHLPDHAEAAALLHLQIGFATALRCHLRRQDPWPELLPTLPPGAETLLRACPNLPDAILGLMAARIGALLRAGVLDTVQAVSLDATLRELGAAQGGTERIRNTPLPRHYDLFPRLFAQLFCVLLPLSLVDELGWLTPLGSTAIGAVFLALDAVGRRLESPFENTPHDVPLSALTRGIEIDLRTALGTEPPPPLHPVQGVLW